MEQRHRDTVPREFCGEAVCVSAQAGQMALPGGSVRIPVLELKFQPAEGAVTVRRFLLDRKHTQKLSSFLACFLGHPIQSLWSFDPKTLVGRQGPLFRRMGAP